MNLSTSRTKSASDCGTPSVIGRDIVNARLRIIGPNM